MPSQAEFAYLEVKGALNKNIDKTASKLQIGVILIERTCGLLWKSFSLHDHNCSHLIFLQAIA